MASPWVVRADLHAPVVLVLVLVLGGLVGCGSGTGGTGGSGGAPPTCGFTACPNNRFCADDPRDSCDPARGGADCPGICVSCPTVLCGGRACNPGEWCDTYFSSVPTCKCGNRGAACTGGDSCERPGPTTEAQCGVLCCGVTGPCPQ